LRQFGWTVHREDRKRVAARTYDDYRRH